MKLVFRILIYAFLFYMFKNPLLLARDIIVITHQNDLKTASMIKNLMLEKVGLPAKLIQIKEVNDNPCKNINDVILHFCVDKLGKVKVAQINQKIISNSFQVFMKNENEIPFIKKGEL